MVNNQQHYGSQGKWPLPRHQEENKKALVQSEKSSENKLCRTICKYSGCEFNHISPSQASNKTEKSSPLDCLVLLGTSDTISADVSVSEPGYFSYS